MARVLLEDGNGAVMAFKIDPFTGFLKKVNEQSVGGKGRSHISIDPKGRFAYTANYGDASVTVFPIIRMARWLKPLIMLSIPVAVLIHSGRRSHIRTLVFHPPMVSFYTFLIWVPIRL